MKPANCYFPRAAIENIPPTQAALLQHIYRSIYQAGYIWGQALVSQQQLPSPSNWGWEETEHAWVLKWTTLSEASKACYELLHCGCKKSCQGLSQKFLSYILKNCPRTKIFRKFLSYGIKFFVLGRKFSENLCPTQIKFLSIWPGYVCMAAFSSVLLTACGQMFFLLSYIL